ncbi:unnamed protein product [Blepharisma stoltei]|uniref:Uncharacterized protein n=1 Tax=Blepharisma stoltei TaxID=1481888 RepID=A0AAU9K2R7_9CILI|nr:unnamed protein product [Blepharisma stoltei]
MIPDVSPNSLNRADWERVLILLTPEAVKQGKIEETIRKLQSKGLILRDSKLLYLTAKMMEGLFSRRLKESEEKSFAMCWEGQNLKNMIKNFCKNPQDLGTEIMYFLYWPELVATKLSVVFSKEEMKKWDPQIELKELQISNENINATFPPKTPNIDSFAKKHPMPLGQLNKKFQAPKNSKNIPLKSSLKVLHHIYANFTSIPRILSPKHSRFTKNALQQKRNNSRCIQILPKLLKKPRTNSFEKIARA